jgi:membrane protein DedA with SNARE-associated domain
MAVPSAQIFIVAGIMRMPALKFLIADAITAIFLFVVSFVVYLFVRRIQSGRK